VTHHAEWSLIPELVNYMQSIPPVFTTPSPSCSLYSIPPPVLLLALRRGFRLSFILGGPDVCGITGASRCARVRDKPARDKPRGESDVKRAEDPCAGFFARGGEGEGRGDRGSNFEWERAPSSLRWGIIYRWKTRRRAAMRMTRKKHRT